MKKANPLTPARPFRIVLSLLISLGLGLFSAFGSPRAAVAQSTPVSLSPELPLTVSAMVGDDYSFTTTASGGNAPYHLSVTGSAPGISTTSNAGTASLSGTFTRTGVYPFAITVTDKDGAQASTATTITVTDTSSVSISVSSGHPQSLYMVGFPVWVSAVVAPGTADSGTPAGSVLVSSGGGNPACTITLSDGQGRCVLFFTASGSYSITAAYAGSAAYLGSSTPSGMPVSVQALSIAQQLSAGIEHSCYLRSDGQARCWGDSLYYSHAADDSPVWAGPFTAVTTGYYQTCGLRTDGTIQCWSDDTAISAPPAGTYTAVSAGNGYACAIGTDSRVRCWGELDAAFQSATPAFAVAALTAGSNHACVLRASDSTPYCWGGNLTGVTVPSTAMSSIAAGRRHTCGVTAGGALACWGPAALTITPPAGSTYTRVGSGSDFSCSVDTAQHLRCWGSNAPAVNTSNTYQALAAGYLHACALSSGSPAALACWGGDSQGQAPRLSLSPAPYTQVLPMNASWQQDFTPAGGHSASGYGLSLSSGSLPLGMSLDGFRLSGTPGQVESRQFVLRLAEAEPLDSDLPLGLAPVSGSYTLTVENPATTITITSADASAFTGAPVQVSAVVSETGTPALSGLVTFSGGDPGITCQTEVVPDADGSGGTAGCALFFGSAGTKSLSVSYAGSDFYTPSEQLNARQVTINQSVINPMISAGNRFSCSVDGDGRADCWGKNDSGQAAVPAASVFRSVSAGQYNTCGVKTGSELACWGWNGFGVSTPPAGYGFISVGAGDSHACALNWAGMVRCWGYPDNRTQAAPSGYWYSSLSVGENHSCAVNSFGVPVCWGSNTYGQASVPAGFSSSNQAQAVAAGGTFSCALDAAGQAVCWGADALESEPSGSFTSISAGHDFACGVRSGGSLECWGSNLSVQTDHPAGSFRSVSAGYNHACAISTDGALACWGSNADRQAPFLTISPAELESIDQGDSSALQLLAAGGRSGGYQYSAGGGLPGGLTLDSSSGLIQGAAEQGGAYAFSVQVTELDRQPALQASFPFTLTVRSPVSVTLTQLSAPPLIAGIPVQVGVTVAETLGSHGSAPAGQIIVNLSDGQSCAPVLDGNGQAACTFFLSGSVTAEASYPGSDLFLSGNTVEALPLDVAAFQQAAALHTDANRTFLHREDGTVECFGAFCPNAHLTGIYTHFASSESAACAIGTDGEPVCASSAQAALSAPAGPYLDIAAGSSEVCAVRLDGSVLCWQVSAPAAIHVVAGSFRSLSAAGENFCAVTGAGGLACWGSAAAQPPAGTFTQVAAAADHACALAADGHVACWGENGLGQSSAPAGQGFVQTVVGTGFSCALDDQGAVRCWGDHALGQADAARGSFTALSAASDHACGLRSGPKVTCWGANDRGEAPQFRYQPIAASEIPALVGWEHFFDPTGGSKPYQATVMSGALPEGISMKLSTAGIVLYGTPTVPDDYAFAIRWEDSSAIPIVLEIPVQLRVTGADLNVSIQPAHATTALIETDFSFVYTVENTTALAVPETVLEISLPQNLANPLVSPGADCSAVTGGLRCVILNFAAHSQQQVTVTGTVRGEKGEQLATGAVVKMLTPGWTELNDADNEDSCEVTTALTAVVYQDGFDGSTRSPAWLQGTLETSPGGQKYLGQAAGGGVNLLVEDIPPHRVIMLEFDLYIIGGWSGIDPLDAQSSAFWEYRYSGAPGPLFLTTFCNLPACEQSFPRAFLSGAYPARSGALQVDFLGYPGQPDARYHFKVPLLHNTGSFGFAFGPDQLAGGTQWGLDNLTITARSRLEMLQYLPIIQR